jgi:REP element-mobilizing transposase RayT
MKFKRKYRIESARLRSWDYSFPGWYFVTICTKQLKPYLGKIDEGCLVLNELGLTTYQYWSEIPQHHNNSAIDEFIVMPNHIHGILILVETLHVETSHAETLPVETLHATSLPSSTMSSISPRKGSLGVIVRSFKSSVTRWARTHNHPHFAWQLRFYDHIETPHWGVSSIIKNTLI